MPLCGTARAQVFPYTTLFRSAPAATHAPGVRPAQGHVGVFAGGRLHPGRSGVLHGIRPQAPGPLFRGNEGRWSDVRVKLIDLDFGTTTSSAVVAAAWLTRSAVTGRVELDQVRECYRSEMVFTPLDAGNRL